MRTPTLKVSLSGAEKLRIRAGRAEGVQRLEHHARQAGHAGPFGAEAVHLRARGVDPWELEGQLGHKKLDVTEIYAVFAPDYLDTVQQGIADVVADLFISVPSAWHPKCTQTARSRPGGLKAADSRSRRLRRQPISTPMRRGAIERFLLWARDEMVDTQDNGGDKLELAAHRINSKNSTKTRKRRRQILIHTPRATFSPKARLICAWQPTQGPGQGPTGMQPARRDCGPCRWQWSP